jgi:hypothetical protein
MTTYEQGLSMPTDPAATWLAAMARQKLFMPGTETMLVDPAGGITENSVFSGDYKFLGVTRFVVAKMVELQEYSARLQIDLTESNIPNKILPVSAAFIILTLADDRYQPGHAYTTVALELEGKRGSGFSLGAMRPKINRDLIKGLEGFRENAVALGPKLKPNPAAALAQAA